MPGRFTERGISFLSSAASVVATASDNASLYAQTKKDAEAKALLLRELNHRVRNNLATIVGLLSMELGRKRQWTAEEALKACIDRAQRLAAIHDLLAQDEFRALDLKKLVEDVAKAAVRGFSWEENVTITVDAPPPQTSSQFARLLSLGRQRTDHQRFNTRLPVRRRGAHPGSGYAGRRRDPVGGERQWCRDPGHRGRGGKERGRTGNRHLVSRDRPPRTVSP